MKVLIVAKTRQGKGACIGAISVKGRSLRLLPGTKKHYEQAGMETGTAPALAVALDRDRLACCGSGKNTKGRHWQHLAR